MLDIQPWDRVVCMLASVAALALLVSAFPGIFTAGTGKDKEVKPNQQRHRHSADDSRLGGIEP